MAAQIPGSLWNRAVHSRPKLAGGLYTDPPGALQGMDSRQSLEKKAGRTGCGRVLISALEILRSFSLGENKSECTVVIL